MGRDEPTSIISTSFCASAQSVPSRRQNWRRLRKKVERGRRAAKKPIRRRGRAKRRKTEMSRRRQGAKSPMTLTKRQLTLSRCKLLDKSIFFFKITIHVLELCHILLKRQPILSKNKQI